MPKDLTGQTFSRLTALRTAGKSGRKVLWECRCECGGTATATTSNLLSGNTRSCGCLQRERAKEVGTQSRRHGLTKTTTHNIWVGMLQRCTNPASKDFPRYGGNGIGVCERWRSFDNFLADMGETPPGMSLDRIDNAKGYSPDNCRWATASQQVRNSRMAKYVTINGRTQCITDWLKEAGLHRATYRYRLQAGWPQDVALTTPPDKRFAPADAHLPLMLALADMEARNG